jgi:hypothetical protein
MQFGREKLEITLSAYHRESGKRTNGVLELERSFCGQERGKILRNWVSMQDLESVSRYVKVKQSI